MNIRTLFIGVMLCIATCAWADNKEVPFNGIITDVLGNPVKGARIYVVKSRVAKSDKLGHFGLTNILPSDTLHVRYNKENYDIAVNGRKSIRIILGDQLETTEDEEIANIGYGFVKKREKIIPSSGVSGEDLVRTGKTNILEALEGLVAGYQYMGGSPRIRGLSSVNLTNEPLYVLDGVVTTSFDFVNIYDVDHVEVLKDASIYGSRGANGAIIVTTKSGNK